MGIQTPVSVNAQYSARKSEKERYGEMEREKKLILATLLAQLYGSVRTPLRPKLKDREEDSWSALQCGVTSP